MNNQSFYLKSSIALFLIFIAGCNSFSNSMYGGSNISDLKATVSRSSNQPSATLSQSAEFKVQFSHPVDDSSFSNDLISNSGTSTGISWSKTRIDQQTYTLEADLSLASEGSIVPNLSTHTITSTTTKQILSKIENSGIAVQRKMDQIRIKMATAGVRHICALSYDRKLFCWGDNGAGQLGTADNTARTSPTEISTSFLPSGDYFETLSAGWFYTCGLTRSGNVWCWGDNSNGELGRGNTTNSNVPVLVDMSAHPTAGPFEKLAAQGTGHICAITQKGALYCWGRDNSGQIGNGSATSVAETTPVLVDVTGLSSDRRAKSVAVGNSHTCAIFYDSMAYCWGQAGSGRLGNNDTSTQLHRPTHLAGVDVSSFTGTDKLIEIQLTSNHTCVLTADRALGCWGTESTYPVFGDGLGGTDRNIPSPVSMAALPQSKWRSFSTQAQSVCGLTTDFRIFCWGRGAQGEMGTGSLSNATTPSLQVDTSSLLNGAQPIALVGGNEMVCLISSDSQLYCWGDNAYGQMADGTTNDALTPNHIDFSAESAPYTFKKIVSGSSHHCSLNTTGTVHCWGNNSSGQLGLGDTLNRSVPTAVNIGSYLAVDLFAFENSTCILNDRAQIRCWGANTGGQFKNGNTNMQLTSVLVSTSADLPFRKSLELAGSSNHLCSLFDSGEVYCWGTNTSGQLGDSTFTSRTTLSPIDSTNFSPILATNLSGSLDSHCLVTSQSNTFCWGENTAGQLGVGNSTNQSTPVALNSGVELVKNIFLGETSGCLINTANATQCWGLNTTLQLGRTGADSTSPVALDTTSVSTSALQFRTIAIGSGSVIGLSQNLTEPLVVWGTNVHKQLGDSTITSSTLPIPASTDLTTDYDSISLSDQSTCAISSSEGIKCWGTGTNGELGFDIDELLRPYSIDATYF